MKRRSWIRKLTQQYLIMNDDDDDDDDDDGHDARLCDAEVKFIDDAFFLGQSKQDLVQRLRNRRNENIKLRYVRVFVCGVVVDTIYTLFMSLSICVNLMGCIEYEYSGLSCSPPLHRLCLSKITFSRRY